MKTCEMCGGMKGHQKTWHGQRITVICEDCGGTGLISLGHETAAHHQQLRHEAHAKAIREGWFEWTWEGATPHIGRTLRRIGPAEFVAVDRGEVA